VAATQKTYALATNAEAEASYRSTFTAVPQELARIM
jgi:hypothetical protein